MTIGVKYWAKGATAPTSWTNLDVLTCYARPVREAYDQATALDGTRETWRRKRYRVTIVVGPLSMATSGTRTVVEALLDAYNVRVKDTRFSYLGDTNTYNFVHDGESAPTREEPSLLTEDLTIELVGEAVA